MSFNSHERRHSIFTAFLGLGLAHRLALTSLILFTSSSAFAQASRASESSRKLYGEAAVTTNYVDKGLTQSDNSWALQAGFGYLMGPQARLGLWGSSVKYPENTESINLRIYFDVNMDFSTTTSMVLRYDFSRYFADEGRNGGILSIDLQSQGYHVMVANGSNWERTQTASTWFGFKKSWENSSGIILTPMAGYTQLNVDGYVNFFDARVSLGYRFAEVLYEITGTATSESKQFNGRGNTTVFASLLARF